VSAPTDTIDPPVAPEPVAGELSATPRSHPPPVPERTDRRAAPLPAGVALARAVLLALAACAGGFVLQVTLVSGLTQRADQQRLYDRFRAQLAEGTAPVGPADFDGVAYPVGQPVAHLEIPELGLEQVVVSGTTSGALFQGPGHRRDTVLPGQVGASVVMGRSAAFGGPFASLDTLDLGDRIEVTTGQGEYEFRVSGVRHEGDPLPDPIQQGGGRLILVTAEGPPFLPDGVLRVDADLVGDADPSGGRLFTTAGLPTAEGNMAGDTSQLWALVLWLQALILVALGAAWSWHRWGRPQTWIVFLPALVLVGMFAAGEGARLLPNLL
jgi:sortase A